VGWDNVFSANGTGLYLTDARSLTLGSTAGNTIELSTVAGVSAQGDNAGTVIRANRIERNVSGIVLSAARNLTITAANIVRQNTKWGLYATGTSTGTVVQQNQISANAINIDVSTARGGTFQLS
jgi:hypothetical protein